MQNDLYKLMIYNLVKLMENRNPLLPLEEGQYSIWTMTDVIAQATNQTSGQVMLDYLQKRKEMGV